MAESPSIEEPTYIEEVFPTDGDDADLPLSDALEGEDDLEITVEPQPAPIGKSAAFDFQTGRFLTAGKGPRPTHGHETIKGRIEKCLRTHRGAHPIHTEGYGMAEPLLSYLDDAADVGLGEMEEAIIEALLFDPAITRVENMAAEEGQTPSGDRAAHVSFTVVLDDGSDFDFQTTIAEES